MFGAVAAVGAVLASAVMAGPAPALPALPIDPVCAHPKQEKVARQEAKNEGKQREEKRGEEAREQTIVKDDKKYTKLIALDTAEHTPLSSICACSQAKLQYSFSFVSCIAFMAFACRGVPPAPSLPLLSSFVDLFLHLFVYHLMHHLMFLYADLSPALCFCRRRWSRPVASHRAQVSLPRSLVYS